MGIAHDTGVFQLFLHLTGDDGGSGTAACGKGSIRQRDHRDQTYYEKTYVQNQILGKSAFGKHAGFGSTGALFQLCVRKTWNFSRQNRADLEGIVSSAAADKRCGGGDVSS